MKFLDGCNRSCVFCVNEDHIGKRINPLDANLFRQSLFDLIDDPVETEKPYGTGGEPLMALDLVDTMFRPLSERGIATRLVTNGKLLTNKRADRLVDMRLAGVKVTYNTLQSERMHALMKGARDNDTTRILDNIKNAKDAGSWIFVRMGFGRHNADEAPAIYRTMREIGVDVVQFKPWILFGLAAENPSELSLVTRQLYEAFARVMEELHEELEAPGAPEVTISCYPPARDPGFVVKDCANVVKIYCEPCGHAMICNFADEYLGSLFAEEGGLTTCVRRRREIYHDIVDEHGIASYPARLNWSSTAGVVNPVPGWKRNLELESRPPVALLQARSATRQ